MMIETRLDMQRAKRQSFARRAPEPDHPETESTAAEGQPVLTVADDLAAIMDADPLQA